MNQRGFVNFIVIGIILAVVLGIGGYYALVKKSITPSKTPSSIISPSGQNTTTSVPSGSAKTPIKSSTSPTKLEKSDPAPPTDQALAEVTVLSQTDEIVRVHIDKILDYIRYPAATNPRLKVDDTISVHFKGWLETFRGDDYVCPEGYDRNPKPAQAESGDQSPGTSQPQPKVAVGTKGTSKLFGCFEESKCQTKGWSGWLYNPSPRVIEYECVKSGTTPPTSQGGLPSVEPKR